MKQHFIFFTMLLNALSTIAFSQNLKSDLEIKYHTYNNQELNPLADPIVLLTTANYYYILTQNQLHKKPTTYPFLQTYVNLEKPSITSIAHLSEDSIIATELTDANNDYTLHSQTKQIQGYTCHKATTVINSNTYTIWYTTEPGIKGGPNLIGSDLGLVLELDRNGTQNIIANSVDEVAPSTLEKITNLRDLEKIQKNDFDKRLHQSRFQSINLFEDQIINFDPNSDQDNLDIIRLANGTVVMKKIKIPLLDPHSQLFLNVNQVSNGDAYDRTGSVFIIPTNNPINILEALQQEDLSILPQYVDNLNKNYPGMTLTKEYQPVIELMRFFTPFGIKQYNHIDFLQKKWQPSASYKQEITEFLPILSNQEIYIAVFIGNYDKGGHKISANIDIHPSMVNNQAFSQVIPLFNTTNVFEMAGQTYPTMFSDPRGLVVDFELDKDLDNAQLRFTTTGHGGWSDGDEFNAKTNTIILDDKQVLSYLPWRSDCASFRDYNPASGNFANGLSSSDLSRSNWCPGTITNPIWVSLGNLKKGKHRITLQIPMGKPQGNSQSFWCSSTTLFGN